MALTHTRIMKSSNVASVGYDPAGRQLEVTFHDGANYRYHGVPPSVHDGLLKAPSAGGFVAGKLRGKFRAERV